MSRTRIVFYGIVMLALLLAVGYWQNETEKASVARSEVVSLMPFSPEWNLDASQKALVVFVYTPDEVSAEQKALFSKVANNHGPELSFAYLDLTRVHPNYSNSAYAEIYGITKSPTIIIRRNGESDYHKHSGSMSVEELNAFIEFSLNNSAPSR